MAAHLCTGPTCWVCGEPTELRDLRWAMAKAMLNENQYDLKFTQCSKLARIATNAIREQVLHGLATHEETDSKLRETLRKLAELEEHHRTADIPED